MELVQSADADEDDRARAARCLKRYVHPDIYPGDAPSGWDAWYSRHKDRIAFVDSAGFYWLVVPTAG